MDVFAGATGIPHNAMKNIRTDSMTAPYAWPLTEKRIAFSIRGATLIMHENKLI